MDGPARREDAESQRSELTGPRPDGASPVSDTPRSFGGSWWRAPFQAIRATIETVIGDIDGKDVLLFDDEVLTGGSMIEAMKLLKARGARRIVAGCTHGVFSGEALAKIDASPVETFVTTNTIPLPADKPTAKIEVVSVARLFGDAIMAIHHGESVSRLLD